VLCIVALAIVAGGCSSTKKKVTAGSASNSGGSSSTTVPLSQQDLTVSYTQGNSIYGDVYYAMQRGYFAENGLHVTLKPINTSTADVVTALASGDAPVNGGISPVSGIAAIAQGGAFKGVAVEGWGSNYILVINKAKAQSAGIPATGSPEDQMKALQAAKLSIAAPAASSGPVLLLKAEFQAAGITNDALSYTYSGSFQNSLAAFEAGKVDSFIAASNLSHLPPEATSLQINFASFAVLANTPFLVVFATNSLIMNHPDTVQAFVNSLVEARQWLTQNPKDALAGIAPMFAPVNVTDQDSINFNWNENFPLYTNPPATMALPKTNFDKTLALYNSQQTLTSKPPATMSIDQFFDNTFINAAIKKYKLSWTQG